MERTVIRSMLALLFLVLCTGPTTVFAQPSPSTPRFQAHFAPTAPTQQG